MQQEDATGFCVCSFRNRTIHIERCRISPAEWKGFERHIAPFGGWLWICL